MLDLSRLFAVPGVCPRDDLERAVVTFRDRGTAFDPVAAVDVADAEVVVDGGCVDVAADHAIGLVAVRFGGERLLEGADVIHRVLDLVLGPFRQRPVRRAEDAAEAVEHAVGGEREVVGLVAEQREPARLRHDQIEDVAVHDQIAAAVGALVHDILHHLDAAEMRAVIAAQEFVVIAGDVDEAGAFTRRAQQLLHHVVMGLRPIPGRAQRPAVDDIADQIDVSASWWRRKSSSLSAWQPRVPRCTSEMKSARYRFVATSVTWIGSSC